jgi:hypothetical protein
MAQFRAEIQGDRGTASRQGSKRSGINGHIHGWNTGARVQLYYDPVTDKDQVRVYRTGGSHTPEGELIAQWSEGDAAPSFYK